MNILGIETSCDETAAAVVKDGTEILSNVVVSQIDIFAAYGGVIPEVAARSHLEAILPVIHKTLKDARLDWPDIDAIAVTHTPGLLGSLLIGTLTARTLAILYDKPLYPVHHLKSHIYANWLEPIENQVNLFYQHKIANPGNFDNVPTSKGNSGTVFSRHKGVNPDVSSDFSKSQRLTGTFASDTVGKSLETSWRERPAEKKLVPEFPILALVISGGHTQILYMPPHNHFQIIGTTRDDAVGECFDKVAKILGLPYPGGPAIAQAAAGIFPNNLPALKNSQETQNQQNPKNPPTPLPGDPSKYPFPHPQVDGLDFSFSGLKTAVLRTVQKEVGKPISFPSHELAPLLTPQQVADFAASFQKTAIDILLEKLQKAAEQFPARSLVFAGGVSANQALRQAALAKFSVYAPTPQKSPFPSTPPKNHPSPAKVFFPDPKFSGDNGAMVAAAAFFEIQSNIKPTDPYHLEIAPRSPIS